METELMHYIFLRWSKKHKTEETSKMYRDSKGNLRSKNNLVMKGGDEVFNFVQAEVPDLINDILAYSNTDKSEIDYFLFHQPNKFMLNKLADKIGMKKKCLLILLKILETQVELLFQ